VLPDLTFSIEKADGTVIKKFEIGNIAETTEPAWIHYGTFFTTPADGSDIVVRLIDKQTLPGNGNDFAVDDITFRPCGPIVEAGFDLATGNINETMCAGNNATYTLKGAQTGYDSPVYQWQQNLNDGNGWVDISGETNPALSVTLNSPNAGTYLYRMGVLSSTNTSLACRIYSDVLTVFVNPFPVASLPAQTAACVGQPLRLTVDQADSYVWTGPNGFSSTSKTSNSVIVADAAGSANNGTYSVIVTLGGCPLFESTNVVVYPPVGAATVNNPTICEGDMAALAVQCPGATQYIWAPSTGLNTTDGATVSASPAETTTYTVTIGNGGCDEITRSATVTVLNKPVANAGNNKTIMSGESVKLDGSVKGDGVSYYWTPPDDLDNANSLAPVASPVNDITYTLHAVSNSTCGDATSTTFVRVYQTVKIPNTFSPNNDGINDYWDIKNLNTYPGSSVLVFNRWGQQVYRTIDYPKPWNGTDNGSPLPEGTYYYVIDLKNGMPKLAGWVLIVR
jgi:gliding motility-associated-like protein